VHLPPSRRRLPVWWVADTPPQRVIPPPEVVYLGSCRTGTSDSNPPPSDAPHSPTCPVSGAFLHPRPSQWYPAPLFPACSATSGTDCFPPARSDRRLDVHRAAPACLYPPPPRISPASPSTMAFVTSAAAAIRPTAARAATSTAAVVRRDGAFVQPLRAAARIAAPRAALSMKSNEQQSVEVRAICGTCGADDVSVEIADCVALHFRDGLLIAALERTTRGGTRRVAGFVRPRSMCVLSR